MKMYRISQFNFLSPQFNNQPDQVSRIIGVDPGNVLYFCEVRLLSLARGECWNDVVMIACTCCSGLSPTFIFAGRRALLRSSWS
jgi:hypothetical protein